MKNRAPLRQEFSNLEYQTKSSKQRENQIAQLGALESTVINAFNTLIKYIDGKTTKTEVVNQLKGFATSVDVEKLIPELEKIDKSVIANKVDLKPILMALNDLKRETTLIPLKMPKPVEAKDSIKVTNLDEIKFDTSAVEKAIKALDLKVDVKAPIINTEKTDLKPLQDIMMDLLKAHNKMAKEMKPMESVKISNLKDITATDLTKVEKKLDESNKHLKTIAEKRSGGTSGGGGNGTPYIDSSGTPKNVVLTIDGKIPVEAAAPVGGATEVTVAALLVETKIANGAYAQRTDDAGSGTTYRGWAVPGTATSAASWRITKIVETTGDYVLTFADGNNNFDNVWDNRTGLTYS